MFTCCASQLIIIIILSEFPILQNKNIIATLELLECVVV